MCTIHDQLEQAPCGNSTDGGEVNMDALFQSSDIDWSTIDVTDEQLRSVTGAWNISVGEGSDELPAMTLSPSLNAAVAEMRYRDSGVNTTKPECLNQFSSTVFPPVTDNGEMEATGKLIELPDDLGFPEFLDDLGCAPNSPTEPSIVPLSLQMMLPESIEGEAVARIRSSEGSPQRDLVDGLEFGRQRSTSQSHKSLRLPRKNPNFKINLDYASLPAQPSSWHIFKYTKHGELDPRNLFTAEEIHGFLWRHPLHNSGDRRKSPFTLRLHRNPPASQHRYPMDHGSHRCRFRECPAENNTIDKGQFVIMFDELSVMKPNHDPYLAAGYVHLYCLERFLDFPKICALLNVRTEKRPFEKEAKNPMRLHPKEVEDEADRFLKACREPNQTLIHGYPSFRERDVVTGLPYEGSLNHRLHKAKLNHRRIAINKQEAAREKAAGQKGGCLGNHMGDLVFATELRQNTRKHAQQNKLIANPRPRRQYKNDEAEDRSEQGDVDAEATHGGMESLSGMFRRQLPPIITCNLHLPPTSPGYSAFGPRIPYKPADGRESVLPMEDPWSHRRSHARSLANGTAARDDYQQQDAGISRDSKKRRSDVADIGEAGCPVQGSFSKSFPESSLDVGARPTKKFKGSHIADQSHLPQAQTHQSQVHQRQLLSKLAHSQPLRPPAQHDSQVQYTSSPSTSPVSGPNPNAIQPVASAATLSVDPPALQPQTVSQQFAVPVYTRKRTRDEAGLSLVDVQPEVAAKKPRFFEPSFQQQFDEIQQIPHDSMVPSGYRPPAQLRPNVSSWPQSEDRCHPGLNQYDASQLSHPPEQYHHHSHDHNQASPQPQYYGPQQGRPLMHPSTPSFRSEAYLQPRPSQLTHLPPNTETPKTQEQIQKAYDRYVQQSKKRKVPNPPKKRKRPAEILGNDGKRIKRKRTVPRDSRMQFGTLTHKQKWELKQKDLSEVEKLQMQQKDLFEAKQRKLRREEDEKVALHMQAIEREEAGLRIEKEEFAMLRDYNERDEIVPEQPQDQIAQLRAEVERAAREKREQDERDEAEFMAEEERAARQGHLS